MKNHTHSYDIIIIGGGLIGLAAALQLQSQYQILLVDPSIDTALAEHGSDFDQPLNTQATQRVTAISPGSQALLASLGCWASISPYANAYHGMHIVDGATQRSLSFDGQSHHQWPMGWMCENLYIQRALRQRIDARRCHTLAAPFQASMNTAAALREGRLSIAHSHGQQDYTADLIIAADGAQSPVRKMLDGPYYEHSYHQSGLVCTIKHSMANENIARQWFVGEEIIAFLPIDTYHCSIVWSSHDAERLQSIDERHFLDLLTDYSAGSVGEITACTPRHAFPLRYGRSASMLHERLLLIGDAAHQIHPMAGLGANLGFADVTALQQHIPKRITTSALRRYNRQQTWESLKHMQTIDALYRLYHTPQPLIAKARGLGMSALDQLHPLKTQIIQAVSR